MAQSPQLLWLSDIHVSFHVFLFSSMSVFMFYFFHPCQFLCFHPCQFSCFRVFIHVSFYVFVHVSFHAFAFSLINLNSIFCASWTFLQWVFSIRSPCIMFQGRSPGFLQTDGSRLWWPAFLWRVHGGGDTPWEGFGKSRNIQTLLAKWQPRCSRAWIRMEAEQ